MVFPRYLVCLIVTRALAVTCSSCSEETDAPDESGATKQTVSSAPRRRLDNDGSGQFACYLKDFTTVKIGIIVDASVISLLADSISSGKRDAITATHIRTYLESKILPRTNRIFTEAYDINIQIKDIVLPGDKRIPSFFTTDEKCKQSTSRSIKHHFATLYMWRTKVYKAQELGFWHSFTNCIPYDGKSQTSKSSIGGLSTLAGVSSSSLAWDDFANAVGQHLGLKTSEGRNDIMDRDPNNRKETLDIDYHQKNACEVLPARNYGTNGQWTKVCNLRGFLPTRDRALEDDDDDDDDDCAWKKFPPFPPMGVFERASSDRSESVGIVVFASVIGIIAALIAISVVGYLMYKRKPLSRVSNRSKFTSSPESKRAAAVAVAKAAALEEETKTTLTEPRSGEQQKPHINTATKLPRQPRQPPPRTGLSPAVAASPKRLPRSFTPLNEKSPKSLTPRRANFPQDTTQFPEAASPKSLPLRRQSPIS
eukprot:GEMP01011436.1.p1 GENE.GEMP01011436.1~~GEMP01011436.1.p1  ORF type:complete len:481 (+),score=83.89 GEMP01011436.1:483-1925(+)